MISPALYPGIHFGIIFITRVTSLSIYFFGLEVILTSQILPSLVTINATLTFPLP